MSCQLAPTELQLKVENDFESRYTRIGLEEKYNDSCIFYLLEITAGKNTTF